MGRKARAKNIQIRNCSGCDRKTNGYKDGKARNRTRKEVRLKNSTIRE